MKIILASLVLGAISLYACPVTQAAPDQQLKGGGYRLGTPDLWTIVSSVWTGSKLAYFSEAPLTVVARRLDAPAPLVWADHVNNAGPSFLYRDGPPAPNPNDHGFMITSLQVPTAGCWEITARYTPAEQPAQTLTYTVQYGR